MEQIFILTEHHLLLFPDSSNLTGTSILRICGKHHQTQQQQIAEFREI
jgi:hypothetical protein